MSVPSIPFADFDRETEVLQLQYLKPTGASAFGRSFDEGVETNITGTLHEHLRLVSKGRVDVQRGETLHSPDELQEIFPDQLVKFDRPLTYGQAKLIRERKLDELKQQELTARAGTLPVVAGYLAGGIADPVGLAAGIAFAPSKIIPMLGGLRVLAGSASNLKRAIGVGALTAFDTAAFSVLAEPYIYYANEQLYADYSMADSLTNVVLGTTLGGVLGAVGGALSRGGLARVKGDIPPWLKDVKLDDHISALTKAVDDLSRGVSPVVDDIIATKPSKPDGPTVHDYYEPEAAIKEAPLKNVEVTPIKQTPQTPQTPQAPQTPQTPPKKPLEAETKRFEEATQRIAKLEREISMHGGDEKSARVYEVYELFKSILDKRVVPVLFNIGGGRQKISVKFRKPDHAALILSRMEDVPPLLRQEAEDYVKMQSGLSDEAFDEFAAKVQISLRKEVENTVKSAKSLSSTVYPLSPRADIIRLPIDLDGVVRYSNLTAKKAIEGSNARASLAKAQRAKSEANRRGATSDIDEDFSEQVSRDARQGADFRKDESEKTVSEMDKQLDEEIENYKKLLSLGMDEPIDPNTVPGYKAADDIEKQIEGERDAVKQGVSCIINK